MGQWVPVVPDTVQVTEIFASNRKRGLPSVSQFDCIAVYIDANPPPAEGWGATSREPYRPPITGAVVKYAGMFVTYWRTTGAEHKVLIGPTGSFARSDAPATMGLVCVSGDEGFQSHSYKGAASCLRCGESRTLRAVAS